MNPTPYRTRWSTAGSFMSAEPADSRSYETKWRTTITTCLPLPPSPKRSNSAMKKTECSVKLAAGFGREKKPFREYLLRSSQPVCFKFEGIPYKVTIEDVKLFPQGYSAIAIHPELIQNEPSATPASPFKRGQMENLKSSPRTPRPFA